MAEEVANTAEGETIEALSGSTTDLRVTDVRIRDEFAPVSLVLAGAVTVGILFFLIKWGAPVSVPIPSAILAPPFEVSTPLNYSPIIFLRPHYFQSPPESCQV